MITYINGSPKIDNSSSNSFLNDLKSENEKIFYIYKDSYQEIINNIFKSDTIVLSFPLYVDSPTSGVLEFLEYITDNNIDLCNKNLYIIVNCGFLESKNNDTTFEIIKCFCNKNKINFKGGLSIGAGPIIGNRNSKFLYKLLTIPYVKKINKLKEAISNLDEINLSTTLLLVPKIIYIFFANINWKKDCKKNSC